MGRLALALRAKRSLQAKIASLTAKLAWQWRETRAGEIQAPPVAMPLANLAENAETGTGSSYASRLDVEMSSVFLAGSGVATKSYRVGYCFG